MAAVLALFSSLAWGLADFGGGVAARRLPVVAVVGWSQAAGLVAVGAAVVVTGAWDGGLGWLPWAVAAGALGAIGLVSFYSALAGGTMGVVAPIAALGVVIPVLAGLLAGERPGWLQAVGMAVAVFGAVAASGPELSGGAGTRSVLLAAVAGVCFGLVQLALARGAEHSALLTLFGMRATSVLGFAVTAVVLGTAGGVGLRALPLLVGVGVLDAAANFFYAVAASRGLLSLVSVLGSLYPVVTVALAAVVLRERMLVVQRVGVALALGGVVAIAAG